jgi:hypothetical protein
MLAAEKMLRTLHHIKPDGLRLDQCKAISHAIKFEVPSEIAQSLLERVQIQLKKEILWDQHGTTLRAWLASATFLLK